MMFQEKKKSHYFLVGEASKIAWNKKKKIDIEKKIVQSFINCAEESNVFFFFNFMQFCLLLQLKNNGFFFFLETSFNCYSRASHRLVTSILGMLTQVEVEMIHLK